MPLPMELTTPPVTKTYLVAIIRAMRAHYMGSRWRIHVPAGNNMGSVVHSRRESGNSREGLVLDPVWDGAIVLCASLYVKSGVSLVSKFD